MTNNLIQKGFILAGLSNILGIVLCSKLFTNQAMMEAQPSVFSLFGLVSVMLWGGAYISVSKNYMHVRWLIGVFAIEKLIYVMAWLRFITTQSLSALYQNDVFAGVFYTIYGPNDFIFMLFFLYVFSQIQQKTK